MISYDKLIEFAEDALTKVSSLAMFPEERRTLSKRIVAQWQKHDCHAGIFTQTERFWFDMIPHPDDKCQINVLSQPGTGLEPFADDWAIDADQFPEIVWQLNETQEAEFVNRNGERIRVRADPREKSLMMEQVS